MNSQLVDITSLSIFFEVSVFLLSGLGTGPSFISLLWLVLELWVIFVYKWLTRNPKIANTPFLVLPNIWRLEQVKDTNIVRNVSNKKLLNAAKYHGYSFYVFWVIKQKPAEGEG